MPGSSGTGVQAPSGDGAGLGRPCAATAGTADGVVGIADPFPEKGLRIGAYDIFAGNSGTFITEIEGLIYVPVSGISDAAIPFARFLPTTFSGVPSGVTGELRLAARIGSV